MKLSGSVGGTQAKNNEVQRIDIELNDPNIDKVCELIYKMRDDVVPMIEL